MAGGDKAIHLHPKVNSNGFDKRPGDAGRPPKLVHHVLEELKAAGYQPVTASQIADAYQTMINLDEKQMREKMSDQKCPMLFRIVITSMLKGKGFEIVEKMIDRAHGKAMEQKKEIITHKFEISDDQLKKFKEFFDGQF